MIKNKKWLFRLMLVLIFGVLILNDNHVQAAKETKKPSIAIKADTTDPTNGNVKLTIKATDASGIYVAKWASGSKDTAYFKSSGKKLTLSAKGYSSATITKNGTYTFYAKDKAGNESIKKFTVNNIDVLFPTLDIKLSTEEPVNTYVKLKLYLKDEGSGVSSIKYLTGKKSEADFNNAGKEISFSETKVNGTSYQYYGKIYPKTNDTFTFLIVDKAGNKTVKTITVSNIDKDLPAITVKLNTIAPTKDDVTVSLAITDIGSGIKEVSYLSGKKVADDFVIDDSTSTSSKPIAIKLSSNGNGSFKVSKNGEYTVLATDRAGNQTLQVINVTNIDKVQPTISLNYTVMNRAATITTDTSDDESGIASISYLKGKVTSLTDEKWSTKAKDVTKTANFKVTSAGNYSVKVTDKAGNQYVEVINVVLEFKAVWISYLEFLTYGKNGYTQASFESAIDKMFDNVASMNMNAVVVQVRPFGDAMYDSSYFPWSRYISGTQGVDPGFDPLEYMVEAAHERGLQFHAWLNPYRVTTASTDYSKLSKDNPARVWHDDKDTSNDRNVLAFDGSLYYNPAVKEVQTLITNGIKEIVNNYEVDGIHFDDYFYPVLGSKYATTFDNVEYDAYVKESKAKVQAPLSIADWRRNNVNTLVKNVYKSIKDIDSTVQFGISPGGFIDSLSSYAGYYVDIKTWLSKDGYIDYICPQIYWSFSHSSYPYDKTLDKWLSYRTSSSVKMYVGIATYKAGSSLEADWKNDPDVLRNQVEYGRDTGKVDGFIFFRYDFFYNSVTKPGVDSLLEIMQ
ncbi:MAG: hypothetical protein K0S41_2478 [Anaerocolumna sp.]|nr:hypothetical protein [Anaerocolumna sp.]